MSHDGGPDGRLGETLGLELRGDRFGPLLDAGTSLPVSVSRTFTTAADGQTSLELTLLRTPAAVEEPRARTPADEVLGEPTFAGIPPAPAGEATIELTLAVDGDGIITVTMVDRETDRRVEQRLGTAAVREPTGGTGTRVYSGESVDERS
jgi:molecular chaperone DnaK (HSP70)